ncbi:hypothetical protein GCM10020000_12190 [Streptomyces olivoverticillatus]
MNPSSPTGASPELAAVDAHVRRVVREKLAQALAMAESEIGGAVAFADYGLDSILAVRLVHELGEALALDLPTSLVYDHSSADRLTAHLLAEHHAAIALPQPSPEPKPEPTPAAGPGGRASRCPGLARPSRGGLRSPSSG